MRGPTVSNRSPFETPPRLARLLAGAALAGTLLAGCGAPGAMLATGSEPGVSAAADTPHVAGDIAKYRLAEMPEGILVRQLPDPKREKMATILSYRAMDNDLEGSLKSHLNDLEAAGSSTYANVLALSDANAQDDSYLHYLCQDATSKLVSPFMWAADPLGMSSKAQSVKEVNTADPRTLETFVGWGFREYPGRFKVLDVASHGSGYQGMCMDFTSNYEQMALPAFGQAVKSGLKGRKLDVLNLLACLMATVEVGYEFRDAAEVMVASEDVIMGGRVMVYASSFGKLAARTDWERADAREVAKQLVADAQPQVPSSGAYTLSAIDLAHIAEVKRHLNILSNALMEGFEPNKRQILAAYDAVPVLGKDKGQSSHRDLIRFCRNLQDKVAQPAIKQAAKELEQTCGEAILVARSKKLEQGAAFGLSIYLPDAYEEFNQAYRQTRLARESAWDEFLLRVKASR